MNDSASPTLLAVARQRVARGVKWLDKKAEVDNRFVGWRLQMMNVYSGRVSSLVRVEWNTDDPLSLTLKYCSELRDSDGRVKWATTAPAFGFDRKSGELKALLLGFHEGSRDSSWYECRDPLAYCKALNQAWQDALGEYRTEQNPWVPPVAEVPAIAQSLGPGRRFARWIRLAA